MTPVEEGGFNGRKKSMGGSGRGEIERVKTELTGIVKREEGIARED